MSSSPRTNQAPIEEQRALCTKHGRRQPGLLIHAVYFWPTLVHQALHQESHPPSDHLDNDVRARMPFNVEYLNRKYNFCQAMQHDPAGTIRGKSV